MHGGRVSARSDGPGAGSEFVVRLPLLGPGPASAPRPAAPAQAGLTLVALSGYGQPDDRAETAAAGFDHHLVKPVDFAALDRILAAAPRR
jgi:CheY-like chemotaxis protein